MATDEENAVEMVRMGYDEPTRNLNFRVGFYQYGGGALSKHAAEAIRVIDQYNQFDAEKIVAALESVSGDLGWQIFVGREASPVIYVEIQRDGADDRVKAALRAADADELDTLNDSGGRVIRAWWD